MSPTTRSTADRLLALSRMSAEVCHADSEADLLVATGHHVHPLFDVDWAGIGLRSTDGRRFRLMPLHVAEGESMLGTDLPADGIAFRTAAETGQIIEETNLAESAYRDLSGLAMGGMNRALVVPLRIGDHAIGAMALARRDDRGFSDEDCLLAMQSAAFIASAIKNLRSMAEASRAETERHKAQMILARRASELDSLNRVFAALSNSQLGDSIGTICDEFAALRGIELCRIAAVDNRGTLHVVAAAAEHGAQFADAGPVVRSTAPDAIAVASGKLALWRRPAEDDVAAAELLQSLGVTSVFSLPIMWEGRPVGSFTAGSTGGHRLVTDEHIVMAEIICQQLADQAHAGNNQGFWETVSPSRHASPTAPVMGASFAG